MKFWLVFASIQPSASVSGLFPRPTDAKLFSSVAGGKSAAGCQLPQIN
jgi:hypothetical protein